MKILFAASTATAIGLVLAGVLGVAGAETPTTSTASAPAPPPLRSVSVQGVATESIEQNASAANATSVYRQGMADAVTDGQSKAQFLASKAAATLGAVQSMTEGGGYIGCSSETEYLGAQPDFGSSQSYGNTVLGKASAPASRPATGVLKPKTKHPRRRKHHAAKKATTGACTLSTQVSLVYALS